MKNIFKIKQTKSSDINLDQIMSNNNLDYGDLNFNSNNSNVLKSYQVLNKKLNSKIKLARNLRTIIPNINYQIILKPIYTIAATTVIILSILFLKEETNLIQYAEIDVDKGEKITLHITDNITIHLNSESSIKVPLKLKRNSEFILDGEALFQISENEKIKVTSNGITVEAKGSEFHINSKGSDLVVVNNISGNVVAYNSDLPKTTKLSIQVNEKMSFIASAGFIAVEQYKNNNFMAWHTGLLKFKNSTLDEVTKDLSNYFNLPIQIENNLLIDQTINTQYKNLNIDKILDDIQLQLNCQISADGSRIIIQ